MRSLVSSREQHQTFPASIFMTIALVNPDLLRWSRIRAGLTTHELATKIPTKPEKIDSWESAEAPPTFRQAQKWASIVHVPFGYLFLREPPQEALALPDLRTVGSRPLQKPSIDLRDTIADAIRKQQWFQEYAREQQIEPIQFIGKFDVTSSVEKVAVDIKKTLRLPEGATASNSDEYTRMLVNAAERVGILVMRSGMADGNTRRKLDVGEFRGFAISDSYAPVIFINSADAPAARLFTLIHEIAHLWIGSTGISDGISNSERKEEIFCNAVAGEFLVPSEEFRHHWKEKEDWEQNIPTLTAKFHVSKYVIARRASDLGLISGRQFNEFYLRELDAYRKRDSSGGDYYATAGAKNSKLFSRAVIAEARSGRLLLRDAGTLLGIGPDKIATYASKIAL